MSTGRFCGSHPGHPGFDAGGGGNGGHQVGGGTERGHDPMDMMMEVVDMGVRSPWWEIPFAAPGPTCEESECRHPPAG